MENKKTYLWKIKWSSDHEEPASWELFKGTEDDIKEMRKALQELWGESDWQCQQLEEINKTTL